MSMGLLTFFQFLGTTIAYLVLTLALPCAVLKEKMGRYRFIHRVLLYFIIGNFYVTNLVFLLELLHISNFITIWIGLLVIPAIIWGWMNKYPFREKLRAFLNSGRKFLTGSLGFKSVAHASWERIRGRFAGGLKKAWENLGRNWPDWLLVIAVVLMVMWVYGIRMLTSFGYAASDIPVHLYWVNGLSDNQIFVAGIYPFGMHAIIYSIHAAFGIDTYVIFRVFALIQTLAIHLMALLFLKLCCKSRFAAYTGVFLYTIGNYIASNNISRYLSSLPQETSMIFIFPTAYFAFCFFKEKSKELKVLKAAGKLTESEVLEKADESEESSISEASEEWTESESTVGTDEPAGSAEFDELMESAAPERTGEREAGKRLRKQKRPQKEKKAKKSRKNPLREESGVALAGLIMSFSLCLSAHFYGAIVAVLFCLGIAAGHIGWVIRPAYFTRLVAAALISVAVTVLPMGIAYAMGTPLQGSLGWATNVIADSIQTDSDSDSDETEETTPEEIESTEQGETEDTEQGDTSSAAPSTPTESPESPATPVEAKPGLTEKLKQLPQVLWNSTGSRLDRYVLGYASKQSVTLGGSVRWGLVLRYMMLFLAAAGLLFLPFRRVRLYGAILLSTAAYMFLMSVLLSATALGIPALMGADRTCIFYAYSLTIVVSFTVDVCFCLLSALFRQRWPVDVLSLVAVVAVVVFIWRDGDVRQPRSSNGLETNEAVTCLTNIIATEKDYTWTIFSANDETQMVHGHGYHYETITFLQEIRWLNKSITVPTEVVYFFIEKVPLDYAVSYWGSGQTISRAGAEQPVPYAAGLGPYQGENRWIVMSHMYFWAQEFQRMYPNEMTVYLETDNFVCYRLEQNAYRLFDLAISYGYNY